MPPWRSPRHDRRSSLGNGEGPNFAEASHCDCPDPCTCYAGGSAAGKDKAYFETEMALQDDTHAVGCGCQPCRIKQTVLETKKLASSSSALGGHDNRN